MYGICGLIVIPDLSVHHIFAFLGHFLTYFGSQSKVWHNLLHCTHISEAFLLEWGICNKNANILTSSTLSGWLLKWFYISNFEGKRKQCHFVGKRILSFNMHEAHWFSLNDHLQQRNRLSKFLCEVWKIQWISIIFGSNYQDKLSLDCSPSLSCLNIYVSFITNIYIEKETYFKAKLCKMQRL